MSLSCCFDCYKSLSTLRAARLGQGLFDIESSFGFRSCQGGEAGRLASNDVHTWMRSEGT